MLSRPLGRILILGLLAGLLGTALVLSGCSKNNKGESRRLTAKELQRATSEEVVRGEIEQQEPPSPAKLEAHGDRLAVQNENLAALVEYNRAFDLAEEKARFRLRIKIARIYLRLGEWALAEKLLMTVTKQRPERADLWLDLGLARLSKGDFQNAEPVLAKAVGLDNRLWKGHNGLGVIYNRTQRPQTALTHLTKALALKPGEAGIFNNLGLAEMLLENLERAEWYFNRALAIDSKHRLARSNLGLLMANQRRWDEALTHFTSVLGEPRAQLNIGVLRAQAGEHLRAAEHFRRALETSPRYYKRAADYLAQVERLINLSPKARVKAVITQAEDAPPPVVRTDKSTSKRTGTESPALRESDLEPEPQPASAGARPADEPEVPVDPEVPVNPEVPAESQAPAQAQAPAQHTAGVREVEVKKTRIVSESPPKPEPEPLPAKEPQPEPKPELKPQPAPIPAPAPKPRPKPFKTEDELVGPGSDLARVFIVQAGVFKGPNDSSRLARKIVELDYNGRVRRWQTRSGKVLYVVESGPYRTFSAADEAAQAIRSELSVEPLIMERYRPRPLAAPSGKEGSGGTGG